MFFRLTQEPACAILASSEVLKRKQMTKRQSKLFRETGLITISGLFCCWQNGEIAFMGDALGCDVVTGEGRPLSRVSTMIRVFSWLLRDQENVRFTAEPRRAKLYRRQLMRAGVRFDEHVASNMHEFTVTKQN